MFYKAQGKQDYVGVGAGGKHTNHRLKETRPWPPFTGGKALNSNQYSNEQANSISDEKQHNNHLKRNKQQQ